MGYAKSLIRDFEGYLRVVVGMEEDDIQLTFGNKIFEFFSPMKYHYAFIQLKIIQRLFTPWEIMKGP